MRQTVNNAKVIGKLYSMNLEQKTSSQGKPYVTGRISIATDSSCVNVVTINFGYVGTHNSKGAENRNFKALLNLKATGRAASDVGYDNATCLSVSSISLSNNEYYSNRTGEWELVEMQRLDGAFSFINEITNDRLEKTPEDSRATFESDMLFTNFKRVDPTSQEEIPYGVLKGYGFTFGGVLIPLELTIEDPNGLRYFEMQQISEATPMFTNVWGQLKNATKVTKKVTNSAFGVQKVDVSTKYEDKWLVVGAAQNRYTAVDLSPEEIKTKISEREVSLATKKNSAVERGEKANALPFAETPGFATPTPTPFGGVPNSPAGTVAAAGGFNFM